MLRHCRLGTSGTSESMSKNGVARLSPGPTVKVSRLPEQPSGPLVRRKVTTLRPALQLLWSITGWRISTPWLKSYAKKAATFSRRSTIPSTGNLPGSSIQKETRQNFGNRLPANDQGTRPQHESTAQPFAPADLLRLASPAYRGGCA